MKDPIPCIVLLALLVQACSKRESAKPADPGYEYFPDRVGAWVEYQVDSAWRDDTFNVDETKSYRLRQVVASHYTDPGGRPSMRIERFILQPDGEWQIRDVWTATRTTTGLEMTEEDIRRLKISFPVREGRTWDTNSLSPEPELLVAARDVDEPYQLSGHNFEKTMAVRTTVPPNFVLTRDLEERYALGVGMIEHHWFFREADSVGPNVPERSVRFDMVMVAYGN